MHDADSMVRLRLLALLAQQLPEHEANALMLLATQDPALFAAEVLAAERVGRMRLTRPMVRMLRVDMSRVAPRHPPADLAPV